MIERPLLAEDLLGAGAESLPTVDRREPTWGARRFGRLIGRLRGRHLFALDLAATVAAVALSVAANRRAIEFPITAAELTLVALLVAVRMTANVRVGLYNRVWRFASIPDFARVVASVSIGSLATIAAAAIILPARPGQIWTSMPGLFWLVEFLLTMSALGALRFAIRAASDWAASAGAGSGARPRATLLYGAGQTGVLMARSARRKPASGVLPVGFLDDDPTLADTLVDGLPVFGGLSALSMAVEKTEARTLLITMPAGSGAAVRRAVDAALELGLDVRTVPSMDDLLDGTVDAYRVRPVRVTDLLRRPIASEHSASVTEIIRDRTVLITGAGGSIGSELARQVFAIRPRRLVLLDRAESGLYLTQRELEAKRDRGLGGGELRVRLASVSSRAAVDRIMEAERPDVVFHAAAYKHVPMMESHPSDAVHVNIGGTAVMLDAAERAGVERFVLVSTDKAVRPTSVMGASKRVAEMLVAEAAARTGRPYVSVRFGNVLGSTGSVVPIFQGQLENGEPLTITHPDMTRFFMTIPEATWLILDAAALGHNGDLFVLDMGEPVKIVDLARDLVRLAGRDPEAQPVDYVGLRPGEKLHEELFYGEERVEPTATPKVLRAIAPPPPRTLRDDVQLLMMMATGAHEARLRTVLLDYAATAHLPHWPDEVVAAIPVGPGQHGTKAAAADGRNGHDGDRRSPGQVRNLNEGLASPSGQPVGMAADGERKARRESSEALRT